MRRVLYSDLVGMFWPVENIMAVTDIRSPTGGTGRETSSTKLCCFVAKNIPRQIRSCISRYQSVRRGRKMVLSVLSPDFGRRKVVERQYQLGGKCFLPCRSRWNPKAHLPLAISWQEGAGDSNASLKTATGRMKNILACGILTWKPSLKKMLMIRRLPNSRAQRTAKTPRVEIAVTMAEITRLLPRPPTNRHQGSSAVDAQREAVAWQRRSAAQSSKWRAAVRYGRRRALIGGFASVRRDFLYGGN